MLMFQPNQLYEAQTTNLEESGQNDKSLLFVLILQFCFYPFLLLLD